MKLRCLLGYHKVCPTKTVRENPFPGVTTYTNAICVRCKKRSWWNWYPEPLDQFMRDEAPIAPRGEDAIGA